MLCSHPPLFSDLDARLDVSVYHRRSFERSLEVTADDYIIYVVAYYIQWSFYCNSCTRYNLAGGTDEFDYDFDCL